MSAERRHLPNEALEALSSEIVESFLKALADDNERLKSLPPVFGPGEGVRMVEDDSAVEPPFDDLPTVDEF